MHSPHQPAIVELTQVTANRVDRYIELSGGGSCGDSSVRRNFLEQPRLSFIDETSFINSASIIKHCTKLHASTRTAWQISINRSSLTAVSDPLPETNPNVRINSLNVLSDSWYTLRSVEFDYRNRNGEWSTQRREAYDRGNGATILLIDWSRRTVLLTRQFRVPAYLNGHVDGMLTEAAAGLLDADDAATAIRREAAEETGCHVREVTPLFELFMSPGSVTERVAFFTATYSPADRVASGGGLPDEGEDIEVIELDLDDAISQVAEGRIVDGKTVVLLQWAQLNDPKRNQDLSPRTRPPR